MSALRRRRAWLADRVRLETDNHYIRAEAAALDWTLAILYNLDARGDLDLIELELDLGESDGPAGGPVSAAETDESHEAALDHGNTAARTEPRG